MLPLGCVVLTLFGDSLLQVEDLLESYFAVVDNSANQVGALCATVDRTEDFVNTDLDAKRNTLIQVDLMTSFATFITSLFTLVAGVFGMNLHSGLEESRTAFDQVAISSALLVVAGFVLFVLAMRRLRLINLF